MACSGLKPDSVNRTIADVFEWHTQYHKRALLLLARWLPLLRFLSHTDEPDVMLDLQIHLGEAATLDAKRVVRPPVVAIIQK